MKTFPLRNPATPPAAIPPDLHGIYEQVRLEWTIASSTWTELEICDETGRRAQERREAAYARNPGMFE